MDRHLIVLTSTVLSTVAGCGGDLPAGARPPSAIEVPAIEAVVPNALPTSSGIVVAEGESEDVIRLGAVEFERPKGWVRVSKDPWVLLHPKDRTRMLGYVEVHGPGDETLRASQLAATFELSEVNWDAGPPAQVKLGAEALGGVHVAGSCHIAPNRHPCTIEYYRVEASALIAYAVDGDGHAPKDDKTVARVIATLKTHRDLGR